MATHLGRFAHVDFIFADRTFSSINAIAKSYAGGIGAKALKLLTCWKSNSDLDFIYTNCYKIVSGDPEDTIVWDVASLKNGISKKVIQLELKNKEISKTFGQAANSEVKLIDRFDYWHILNKNETQQFYENLKHFYHYFKELCTYNRRN